MLCMGVDIESGSPSGRALYSVMVVDESSRVVYKSESVTLPRLIRLVWELKPSVVALDNVFELADSEKKLLKVFAILPPETRVVQVTMTQDGLKNLKQVAREAGLLEDYSKLTPSKTAFVLALLSCKGYGTDVRVVEERTVVHVSGKRSGSKGGWSQQRYQRRVRAEVQAVARAVREALDRAGLDYDYSYRESRGGLESAVFTVYAPHRVVREALPRVGSPEVSIRVKPVVKSKIALPKSREVSERLLIVGVDPGVTLGLAVLDAVSGEVLYVGSGRHMDRGSVIDLVLGYGKPVVVAADVAEPAEAVKKLAAQLGAHLYTPPHDLSVSEKHYLTESYSHLVSNTHERDALAAAIRAHRVMTSRLRKVEKIASRLSLDVDLSEAKREVLRGASVADALEKIIEKALEEEALREARVAEGVREKKQEADVSYYIVKIEELKERNRVLEAQVSALEERVRELESALRAQQQAVKIELLRDSEIEALRSRVRELEREAERLRGELEALLAEKRVLEDLAERVARGEVAVAAVLPSATLSSLREAQGFKIVTVKNPGTFEEQAIREAVRAGVECFVLRDRDLESPLARALARHGVPVVRREDVEVAEYKSLLFLSKTVYSRCAEEKLKLEKSREKPDIERIIEDYRRLVARESEKRARGGEKSPQL